MQVPDGRVQGGGVPLFGGVRQGQHISINFVRLRVEGHCFKISSLSFRKKLLTVSSAGPHAFLGRWRVACVS